MVTYSKTPLPHHSRLWAQVQPGDFIDGHAVASSLSPCAAAQCALSMPFWAKSLLDLRNLLLRPFGLKTDTSGEGSGAIFPVVHEDHEEMILGTDDRHLNFRICIHRAGGQIHMATWVHCNNIFGRAYLAAVMPFHILIVRDGMRRIARKG